LKYLGFFFLIPKYFLFYFKGFLFENLRYTVNLTNIIGFILVNILSILGIFNSTRNNILLIILFITNTRSYVSFACFCYYITKGNRTTNVTFR
jgi:hypothetical protein